MGKIVSLPVAEGDRVRAGQVLAQIDRVQAQSDAASATEQDARPSSPTSAPAQGRSVRPRPTSLPLKRACETPTSSSVDGVARGAMVAAADPTPPLPRLTRPRRKSLLHAQPSIAPGRTSKLPRGVNQSKAQQRRAADVLEKTSIPSPIDGVCDSLARAQRRNGGGRCPESARHPR